MISTIERKAPTLSKPFMSVQSTIQLDTRIQEKISDDEKGTAFVVVPSLDQIKHIIQLPEFKNHDVFLHTFNGKGITCDIAQLLEAGDSPYARIQAFFKSLLLENLAVYPYINYKLTTDYLQTVFEFLTRHVPIESFAPSLLFSLLTNKENKGTFIVEADAVMKKNNEQHKQLLSYYQANNESILLIQHSFSLFEKDYLNYNPYALPEEAFNERNIHVLVLGDKHPCFAERLIIERMAQLITEGYFDNQTIHVFLEDYHRYRTIHTDAAFIHNYQPNIQTRNIRTARSL